MRQRQRYPGRPRVEPQAGKKATVGLRLAPSLKEKLIREAEWSDRTLSQVIEWRLEASLRDEQLVEGVLDRTCGPRVAGLLMAIARLAQQLALDTRPRGAPFGETEHLLSRAYPFAQLAEGISKLLGGFQPGGDPSAASYDFPALPSAHGPEWDAKLRGRAEHIGEEAAAELLEDLRDPIKRQSPVLAPIATRLPVPERMPDAGEKRTIL